MIKETKRKNEHDRSAKPPFGSEPQGRRQAEKWRALAGAAFLFIATFIVYIPALRSGFIWDDPEYVLHNQTLRSLEGLRAIWLIPTSIPQWYPLVHTTFWIEYHLVGTDPALYHIDNVLLHAISCILLWRLLVRLEIPGAYFAACLFAVHPVMVESVAWVTERKNVLSLVFYLLALRVYLFQFAPTNEDDQRQNWRAYALSLVLFLAALFSKTVTASLPAAILLILWWKKGRLRLRDVVPLVPFFVLGAGLGFVTGYLEKHYVNAFGQLEIELPLHFWQRCLIAGRAICFYVGKLVYPHPLTFIYPRWNDILKPTALLWVFPVLVLLITAILALARNRIGRGALVAWLLFCGTLFPALGFVNVYPMRYSFVADHFQYHAAIALIVLFAAAVAGVPVRAQRAFQMIVLGGLGFLTFQQTHIYKNAWTLWSDTVKKNPNSWMVWTNLGKILAEQQRYDQAKPYFDKALELAPNVDEVRVNAGISLVRQGKVDEAEQQLDRALQINPKSALALETLGELYLHHRNDPKKALEYFDRAIAVSPNDFLANFYAGLVLERQAAQAKEQFQKTNDPAAGKQWLDKLTAAIEHYRTAAGVNPDDWDAHYNLANCLVQFKQYNEAIEQFREALRIDPNRAETWTNLGNAYFQTGNLREAANAFTQALRIKPDLEPAKRGLMAAHARM